jgi:CheY-like chemotaxis protein
MDCQMPEMDGYEASARIRAWETGHVGVQRVPIVAITANALPEDLSRCLAAGMDDYLAKPVLADDLKRTLVFWLNAGTGVAAAAEAEAASAGQIIDPRHLREFRKTVAAEDFYGFLGKFDGHHQPLLAGIRAASMSGSSAEAAKLLHVLKGGSAFVGGIELPALCKTLELLAKAGNTAEVAARIGELEAAYARLLAAVLSFRTEQAV